MAQRPEAPAPSLGTPLLPPGNRESQDSESLNGQSACPSQDLCLHWGVLIIEDAGLWGGACVWQGRSGRTDVCCSVSFLGLLSLLSGSTNLLQSGALPLANPNQPSSPWQPDKFPSLQVSSGTGEYLSGSQAPGCWGNHLGSLLKCRFQGLINNHLVSGSERTLESAL